jgi:hypothetical protein
LLSAPTILRIDPAHGLVPANALRLHVQFDRRMRVGVGSRHVFRHVELRDARGHEIPGAFLEREVWSADGMRLTLHLDAERQRHGWAPGPRRMRPVLSAGEWHELRIGPGLLCAEGIPMRMTHQHAFRTGSARLARVQPETWKLATPAPGTREPLIVALPHALDRPHLLQRISVQDASAAKLTGTARLSPGGTCWAFEPLTAWAEGSYALEVRGRLDDGCGNNIWCPAHAPAQERRAAGESMLLHFSVGDGLEAGRTRVTTKPEPRPLATRR